MKQNIPSPTHMAIETAEAPAAVGRMLLENTGVVKEIAKLLKARQPSHILTCARGSSDHAAGYLKYLTEIFLGVPCCSIGASVVSVYGARLKLRDSVLVCISQSGRSPDILAVQEEARRAGAPTLAITNDPMSPLGRAADFCLPLAAGPEVSVAATKTFITSAALVAFLVSAWADNAGLREGVERLPKDLEYANDLRWTPVEDIISTATSMFVLGRGPSFPIAQEAALKLKETSGLHAEAYSAAEVMHGPMELVRDGFPILVFAPADQALLTTTATLERLRASGANVLQGDYHRSFHTALDPISIIQSFYRCAERVARRRNRNPDEPLMLRKVTATI